MGIFIVESLILDDPVVTSLTYIKQYLDEKTWLLLLKITPLSTIPKC